MSSARALLLLRRSANRKNINTIVARDGASSSRVQQVLVRYHATTSSTGRSAPPLAASITTNADLSHQQQQPSVPSREDDTEISTTTSKTTKTKAYADLAKAKLSALVVSTTACGFLAAGGPFDPIILSSCVVGTALCSSSAAGWNQIIEIDRDSKMKRTQQRPLVVQGDNSVLTVNQAQKAATVWGMSGVGLLYIGTDPITTILGASNIVLYAGLYTWLKPRSIYNTWVGAIVGAIPPVMGWTAATGGSLWDVEAAILGATLFTWQMPHFFALSFMHRQDYARGGFAMVPVLEMMNNNNNNNNNNGTPPDYTRTANLITRYATYLSTIPFVATAMGVTSSMFAFEGIVLNSYALWVAHKFSRDRTNANARKVFLTSLWYLPSFMMLFLLHSKVWEEDKEEAEVDLVRQWISERVHRVRDIGRELCIHEKAIVKHNNENDNSNNSSEASQVGDKVGSTGSAGAACPVVLGQQKSREGVEVLKRRATEQAVVVKAAAAQAAGSTKEETASSTA